MKEISAMRDGISVEGVIDFLYSDRAHPITPWQVRYEMEQLARLLAERKPRTLLEIGTANGGTLFVHARLASEDALLISIDLPGGAFGGGYPEWRVPLYKSFRLRGQQMTLLREDSHATKTHEMLSEILDGRRFDYCFIDGDHSYDGVKQDFELCRSLAAPGALIAFHDIVKHHDKSCRVFDFWQELKHCYPHAEIIEGPHQTWAGIGCIYLG
jgi:predicted O-methyltransferase YrrM